MWRDIYQPTLINDLRTLKEKESKIIFFCYLFIVYRVEFASKFSEQPNRNIQKKGTIDVKTGIPFEPSVVYQMLSVAQTSMSVKVKITKSS